MRCKNYENPYPCFDKLRFCAEVGTFPGERTSRRRWMIKCDNLYATARADSQLAHGIQLGRKKNTQRFISIVKHYSMWLVSPIFILMTLARAGGAIPQTTAKGFRQAAMKTPVWAVQLNWTRAATKPAQAWPERTFAKIAADGIHYAEINMEWGKVEPQRGKFNFTLLDQTLANAAKAHVQIIPIFWYAVWAKLAPV